MIDSSNTMATGLKQYYVSSKPRHLRYIYFIDRNYPYQELFKLMSKNQLYWGGRFNPIIPVTDGIVAEQYKAILKYYDPDYIFHTSGIDSQYLKTLADYNPKEYFVLDQTQNQNEIKGIDGLYFISQFSRFNKVILPHQLYVTDSILLSYYELNFGIGTNISNMDVDLAKNYYQIEVTPDHFDRLNEIIYTDKPINRLLLAQNNTSTVILRSDQDNSSEHAEIVISKQDGTCDDLLYFWNRKLYGCKSIIYLTANQLDVLKNDSFFGPVLYSINKENFNVVSMSLNQKEMENIIENIFRPMKLHVRFTYANRDSFPFIIRDHTVNRSYGRGEEITNQLLVSEKGLFHLPKLSFTDKVGFYPQKWAVDIEISRIEDYIKPVLRFPKTTDTRLLFSGLPARITKNRTITLFIANNNASAIEVNIPHIRLIIHQLITNPVSYAEVRQTSLKDIRYNDSGNKLAAFIKAFQNNFHDINDFFTDIFWVETFEYLIKNNRQAGDALSFSHLKERCIEKLKERGIELTNGTLNNHTEESLEKGLKSTLELLCSYQVFFKGFNLKCTTCSSTFWYHINDIAERIKCKGCLHEFTVPAESKFFYKLNDLIKNNMFQTKELRDGNLTVIRTLIWLKQKSRIDFAYLPQVDVYKDFSRSKPYTDLDLVCIVDGKFFIGEAKHTSTAFFDKNSQKLNCLEVLAAIAQEIFPDSVVLSCYEDPHKKLEKAKKTLQGILSKLPHKPEVEIKLLDKPDLNPVGGYMYFQ